MSVRVMLFSLAFITASATAATPTELRELATTLEPNSCSMGPPAAFEWLSPAFQPSSCRVACFTSGEGVCVESSCCQLDETPCWCNGTNLFYAYCFRSFGTCPTDPYKCRAICTYTRTDWNHLCTDKVPPNYELPTIPLTCPAPPANATESPSANFSPVVPQSKVGANSVSVTTGMVFFTHTDAVVGDLAFSRSFNSGRVSSQRYGVFGMGWNTSFEARLIIRSAYPKTIEARSTEGDPQYYYDHDANGFFEPFLPYSTETSIERTPTGYRRVFRAGGDETYDLTGRLLSVRDWSGLTTTYTRDTQGRLSSVTRLGRGITITYSGTATRPWRLYGPNNTLLATYTYIGSYLDTVTYADGSGYKYTYDGGGRVLTVKDLEGKKLEAHTYQYISGAYRAKTTAIGDDVEKRTFTYETNKTIVTDALGNVTTFEYANVRGTRQVTKITGPCSSCGGGGGDSQEWTYDAYERITSYKDGKGNLVTYTYDPATGDLLSETHRPDPQTTLVTTYTHHPDGRVKTRTDPRGGSTTWNYETVAGEEKETITELVEATETREMVVWRNALGKPRLLVDPRGKETELFYTPAGDLDFVRDADDKETHFAYDVFGRRTQVIPPPASGAKEPLLEYDLRGQVLRIIDPEDSNKFTRITYDKGGRRKSVEDPLHRITEYGYDTWGRLETVTQHRDTAEGPPLVTTYGYDNMSNLKLVRDARGKETGFDYDRNRLSKMRYPLDTGETTPREEIYTYDLAGRLQTRTDRRGVVTTFDYDGLGRLTSKSYSGPIVGAPATFTYDDASNLATAAQGTVTLSWAHDLAGQVREASDGLSTLAYTYWPDGSRKTLALAQTGFALDYDYDDLGRLWHIRRGTETFTFEYDAASRRRLLTFPNGVVAASTPDALSRLDLLTVSRPGQTLHSFDYAYDAAGNRRQKVVDGVAEDYAYDSIYRLDTVRRSTTLIEDFAYDEVGNRKGTLAIPSPSAWTYSYRNELQGAGPATYQHDRNGNLTAKTDSTGSWTYEWDVENRLTRVTRDGSEVARFSYDPLGRRIEKLASGQSTRYSYDGEDIVRERVGATDRHYVHGPGIDEPLAQLIAETANYFHADGLGSIVSRSDASGVVADSRSYDAFGNLETGAGEAGYAFTGREWDPETGLYYYRARYYDPKIGRFISEDPIGFGGGNNFYQYVENDPVGHVDPMGFEKCRCTLVSQLNPFDLESSLAQSGTAIWDAIAGAATGNMSRVIQSANSNPLGQTANGPGWAYWGTRGSLTVAGTAAVAAGGLMCAELAGVSVQINLYQHGGGGMNVLRGGIRRFAVDWHKFKLDGRMVNRPHIHRGATKTQMKKHRPWQGGL